MAARPGSRIVVESERVGQLEREGEILEVMQSDLSVRYRVRWNDGRETLLSPAGGSVRILDDGPAAATSTPKKSSAQKSSAKKSGAKKSGSKERSGSASKSASRSGSAGKTKGKKSKKGGKG